MTDWWNSLDTALRVFYAIAIATSAAMLLQLLLMVFGLDGDGDVDLDVDVDADGGGGVGILSVRTVTAFFAGFGWAGVAALESGLALPPTLLIATAVGGAFMAGVFFLMRTLYGLRYSGTLDYRNAVGQVGNVYLRVPAAMAGPGQIEVMIQGRLCTVQAFTRAAQPLESRSRVKVVDLVDQGTLLVEPLATAPPATGKES